MTGGTGRFPRSRIKKGVRGGNMVSPTGASAASEATEVAAEPAVAG